MGVILPFVLACAFEPDDIEAMSLACEEVCNSLHINGDALARETIAARVIELARRGERCPTVLRDRVLALGHMPAKDRTGGLILLDKE